MRVRTQNFEIRTEGGVRSGFLCALCAFVSLCFLYSRLSIGRQRPCLYSRSIKRRRAQFQKKVRRALPKNLRTLVVVLLEPRSSDGACNTQWSLAVFIKNIHPRTFFDEKLHDRVDSFVGCTVKRRPLMFSCRIDIGSEVDQKPGDLE